MTPGLYQPVHTVSGTYNTDLYGHFRYSLYLVCIIIQVRYMVVVTCLYHNYECINDVIVLL